MRSFDGASGQIVGATATVGDMIAGARDALESMQHGVVASAAALKQADGRIKAVVDIGETLLARTADAGAETDDTAFVRIARDAAGRIAEIFEDAVRSGALSAADLFDRDYVPIDGTEPTQYRTRFADFTDRALSALQDAIVDGDPRIVSAAAVDDHGYLPTHNRAFSQPQRADAEWNAAHARNRRIFDDRVGRAAAKSVAPFLLQTYRRDNGGAFLMMKDASAPIFVDGRHWGAFRVSYRSDH